MRVYLMRVFEISRTTERVACLSLLLQTPLFFFYHNHDVHVWIYSAFLITALKTGETQTARRAPKLETCGSYFT
jgi:hypothetical protein